MKLVISDPKSGKTYQADVDKSKEVELAGKKIGDSLDGGVFGAAGYSFEITGGSDTSGFPLRKDIGGTRKLSALLSGGAGFNPSRDGERKKKMVRGNTIAADTSQVNVKVLQAGATALEQLFPKKEGEKK